MGKIQAKPKRKPVPIERQFPPIDIVELARKQGVKPFSLKEWEAKCAQLSDEVSFDGFIEWREQLKAESPARPPKDKFK